MKKVCVIGLGYIGLPMACLIARGGFQVVGVDVKAEMVDRINHGEVPFGETGLSGLLEEVTGSGALRVAAVPEPADVFLICTPTPLDRETRMAELQMVRNAANSIVGSLRRGSLVIVESTVPPGTTEMQLIPILESGGLVCEQDFLLAHCPERAIPGNTIHEMVHNDRIIGGVNKESAEAAKSVYSSFVQGNLHLTDLRTAEIVKLMENSYRDINIALANEFAQIAEEISVHIWEAITLANKHPRVHILNPGPGVGGHCIAVDPWFLIEKSNRGRIVGLAREINDSMPRYVLNIVRKVVKDIRHPLISVLGVAYKGNIDDTRETPALKFIKLAENDGFQVKAHDPLVKEFEYPLVSEKEVAKGSDCLVVITDHDALPELSQPRLLRL